MNKQWGQLGNLRTQIFNRLNKQSAIALARPVKPKLNPRAKSFYPKGLNPRARSFYPKGLNPRARSFSPKSQNYVLSAHGGYLSNRKIYIPKNVKIIFFIKEGSPLGLWGNEIQTRVCENPNKESYIYSRGKYLRRKEAVTNQWINDYYFQSDRVYFTLENQTTRNILKSMNITFLHFLDLNPQYIKKIKLDTKWKAGIRLNRTYSSQFYTTKKDEVLTNILNQKNQSVNKFCNLNYYNADEVKAEIKKVGVDNMIIPKGARLLVMTKSHFYSGLVKCSNNRVIYNIDTMGPISLSQLIKRIWKPDEKFVIHAITCRSKIH